MAYTDIDKPSDYFNTVLYSGNSSTNAITGVGHQPDLTWIKRRNSAQGHIWIDSVRGIDKRLGSNVSDAESTVTYFTSFDTDGFTLNGTNIATNVSGGTFTAWNWLAGGTGVSNTDGSITSTVSANNTSGFSIVSWTGNGVDGASIGHGLVNPNLSIIKRRDASGHSWNVNGHPNTALFVNDGDTLNLDSTSALSNSSTKEIDLSTDSGTTCTFVDSGNDININGGSFIGYFFKNIKGYSKIGSYTGNGGGTDGTFVYTGFKPAWIMVKRTDSTDNWIIFDNKRNTSNVLDKYLYANLNDAESTGDFVDFTSNGFKWRRSGTANAVNGSGATYFYMAFAESPFVTSTGIPTTAR